MRPERRPYHERHPCTVSSRTRAPSHTERGALGKKSVHYLIEWAGAQWVGHDTWEPVDQLQGERVKALVNEYNEKLRAAK